MLTSIILLTGKTEAAALTGLFRQHNDGVAIHAVHTLDELEALGPAVIRCSRLIGFVTPVVVPPRILDALGFGAYNFHPGPPHYPGWVPAHFAIYDKASTFGATAHRMAERVDAGVIIDAELFVIPPGTSVRRLQELAFIEAARLIWRLAPALATRSEPLPALPLQWSGVKSTKVAHRTMCDLSPDIPCTELEQRIKAFGDGDFGVDLTVTLHGHKFRYVPPEAAPAGEPAALSPAALVA